MGWLHDIQQVPKLHVQLDTFGMDNWVAIIKGACAVVHTEAVPFMHTASFDLQKGGRPTYTRHDQMIQIQKQRKQELDRQIPHYLVALSDGALGSRL
jgi:hypothetical protein